MLSRTDLIRLAATPIQLLPLDFEPTATESELLQAALQAIDRLRAHAVG
jgi:hypothetical protein